MTERYKVQLDCTGDKIRTKQSFKKESDINNILKKFLKTGVISQSAINKRQATFADVSQIGDFADCHNRIVAAGAAFGTLPAAVRARFANTPAELLDFLSNPANRQEAIDLGIIPKPEELEQPPPETPETPPEA